MSDWTRRLAVLCLAGGSLLAAPVFAQEEASADPAGSGAAGSEAEAADTKVEKVEAVPGQGRGALARDELQEKAKGEDDSGSFLSFDAGVDVASSYYFRGIPQQTKGVAVQPYFNMGLTLWEATEDIPIGMSLTAGMWNNLDTGTSNPWYEADFIVGGAFDLPAGFEFGAAYIYLYNPNGGSVFAEEVDLSLAMNETETFGLENMPLGLSFNPYALLAIETKAGADGLGAAGDKGTYLELGLEPSIELSLSKDYPLTLSLPLTLGLSVDKYYEDSTGRNDTFGFFDIAVAAGLPLAFIPPKYGSWTLTGAVHVNVLGQAAQNIGNVDSGVPTDDVNAWVSFGLAVE